jgi:excisionase family DNA binding protein
MGEVAIEAARFYTVEELAPLLRVTRRTLRKYCNERVFPNAFKLGGVRWLIPGADVLALCPQVGHTFVASPE